MHERPMISAIATTALIAMAALRAVADPLISVDPADYIPAPPPYSGSTVFVVPVEIADAVALTSWQFSLSFDPADVQINTGCDASGTDPYCDPLFGPVTEGPFFSSVALFPPLFDPGFILNGLGLLDAVAGAWQDPPPGPSGAGVLAYVEFITTANGSGESPITIVGTSTTSSVPEPTTMALLLSALALLGAGHVPNRRWVKGTRKGQRTIRWEKRK
jgi:PEP-CTERM motif